MDGESKNIGDVIKNKLIKKNQYLVCYREWWGEQHQYIRAFIDVEEKENALLSGEEIYNAIIKHHNDNYTSNKMHHISDVSIIVLTRIN